MAKPKPTRTNELGEEEAYCAQCGDWWPIETYFFPLIVKGRAQGACRACRLENERRYRPQNFKAQQCQTA